MRASNSCSSADIGVPAARRCPSNRFSFVINSWGQPMGIPPCPTRITPCTAIAISNSFPRYEGSHVSAQHQFFRMRIEIDLVTDVADVKDFGIVFDQRQRDDQGGEPVMVISDYIQ